MLKNVPDAPALLYDGAAKPHDMISLQQQLLQRVAAAKARVEALDYLPQAATTIQSAWRGRCVRVLLSVSGMSRYPAAAKQLRGTLLHEQAYVPIVLAHLSAASTPHTVELLMARREAAHDGEKSIDCLVFM